MRATLLKTVLVLSAVVGFSSQAWARNDGDGGDNHPSGSGHGAVTSAPPGRGPESSGASTGKGPGSSGTAAHSGTNASKPPGSGSHQSVRGGPGNPQVSSGRGPSGQRIYNGVLVPNRRSGGALSVNRGAGPTSGPAGGGTINPIGGTTKWAREDKANKKRFDAETQDKLRNWQGKPPSLDTAKRNHDDMCRHHHGRDWWRNHCPTVILVNWGWWGWWDGWWYPAWGYDPYYSTYEYDGPIYGYDGLPPDEVVANVQGELQRLGYYSYSVDGVLGPITQAAIVNYQRDHRLPITGAIDPPTVGALGLMN